MAIADVFKTAAAEHTDKLNTKYGPLVQTLVDTVNELREAGAEVSLTTQNLLSLADLAGPTYTLTIEGNMHLVYFPKKPCASRPIETISLAVSSATLPEIIASDEKHHAIADGLMLYNLGRIAEYTPRLGENTSRNLETFKTDLATYAAQLKSNRELLVDAQKTTAKTVGFNPISIIRSILRAKSELCVEISAALAAFSEEHKV